MSQDTVRDRLPGLVARPGLLALPRSRGAGKLGAQEAERQVSVKDE
jgi:hypothetical protein